MKKYHIFRFIFLAKLIQGQSNFMSKELTDKTALVQRQNILNNPYAIKEIENAVSIRGIPFEGKTVLTKEQVAKFFEITVRSIENYLAEFSDELKKNGYEVLDGNRLNTIKLEIGALDDSETDFGNINKTPKLAIFDFRAFLNLGMLIRESSRASLLRKAILDIVIDSINKRSGNDVKYINQRADGFLNTLYQNKNYRKEFTDALRDYVDMGNFKYSIYTEKIHVSIFKERAQEYKKILKLENRENIRHTLYAEVLEIISAYEYGLAVKIKEVSEAKQRKLSPFEVDVIFNNFQNEPHWVPLLESARTKMASRDLAFREVLHERLLGHIAPLNPTDFEKFLGETSKTLDQQMEQAKDVLKRLKEDTK